MDKRLIDGKSEREAYTIERMICGLYDKEGFCT